jgi:hypothetical protein
MDDDLDVDDDETPTSIDEVTHYLNSPVECSLKDASPDDLIRFWMGKKYEYPGLSRMALDYLAIPATSV